MKAFLILALAIIPFSLFGMEVYIAPILCVDETEDFRRDNEKVKKDLLNALRSVETGIILQFNEINDSGINPPQSLTEAVTVCRNFRIDYLLYGFVTKKTHTIQMEIRFFDYEKRQVLKSFFGMDDGNNYERLVKDISVKILSYIEETMNLELIKDRIAYTRLCIPAGLGYWTPMDEEWVKSMFGTFVIGTGLEFVPTDNLFVFSGLLFYISTGLELKYRLGVGNPDRYEAYNSTIYFTIPARLTMLLAKQHEIVFGPGLVYFLEIFSMADKYDNAKTHVYNNMGLNLNLSYRFIFNDKISFFMKNDFDFLFNEDTLITYSPMLGVNIKVYEKEVKRKKW